MYYLLERKHQEPRVPSAVLVRPSVAQLQALLPLDGSTWALDLETKGTDAASSASQIVGIGLANAEHCFYIDWSQCSDSARKFVRRFLEQAQLIAFNVFFDGSFLYAACKRWLNWVGCAYGLGKQLSNEGHPGQSWSLETFQRDVLGWMTSNKTVLDAELKARGLTKATMWELSPDILGPYCASDADAAWQLWHVLVGRARELELQPLLDYHQRLFMTEVKLLVEQQHRGLWADPERLQACRADLTQRISSSMTAFLEHPDVAHHIGLFNKEVRDAWIASQPPQTVKGGGVSKRWEQWRDREQKWMAERGFNPNSKPQLCWLFYEQLKCKILKRTPTGRAVVDRKVLPALGEPGKLLAEYNLHTKRSGYLERVIDKSADDELIHPQFNTVGTLTSRLGGSGGLNMQQMPKVPEFLWALRARPGHKLVQADAEALEPVILAEFSQDKTLLQLYGPGAPANDVYLFVAAKIPALGKEIRKHYNADAPTPEGIAAAKKHCKRDRSIAKLVHLSSAYGAGPKKIHETLTFSGIDISLNEVRQIHTDYWKLFGGVKRWEARLADIWQESGGWVPSILGTPICVAEGLLKDIVNRHTQCSGHLFLQLWIWHTDRLRQERGVEMYPWLVDQHDEQVWEAPEEYAEAAAQVLRDALSAANDELGMEIRIKAPPMIADDFAAIKCESYEAWIKDQNAKD